MSRQPARGGATPATTALTRAGVEHVPHTYVHDLRARADGLGYGREAAAALDVASSRVFKTLVLELDARALGIAVIPVDAMLDLRAAAAVLGAKRASLAEAGAAERATGYVVGGISPFGQRRVLPTVVDETALKQPTVFVSGGRRGLDVEVSPADLVRLTRARTASISRPDARGAGRR